MTTPIPHPTGIPWLGNLNSIDFELPIKSTELLARKYGEIFSLKILGEKVVFISSVRLAQEVLDESRFHKHIESTLEELRILGRDALFTARHDEPNWGVAHRILMPAFGPLSIKGMFNDMADVASQLVLKWERFGPNHMIDPTDDFTRLTFDTIALCAFNYRLNSFYTQGEHPFVKAMSEFLTESGTRTLKPGIVKALSFGANAKYAENMKIMSSLATEIIEDRKKNPIEKKDLLNAMLLGRDPQTGQGLSEENINAQMLTFLIAGHETTSGMLSFAMGHITKHPEVYAKVRQEVDIVVGQGPVKPEHLSKLTYVNAVLRETLRVTPSISEFAVSCDKDQIIGDGKYLIKAGTTVAVAASNIGKDPAVWGEDAEKFNPDRMLDGKFEALPPKAWVPFGSGARGCIGRPFAWQEALIVIATIFQKFDFVAGDPTYNLQLKQTLTLKPKNFTLRAIPRKDAPSFAINATSSISDTGKAPPQNIGQNDSGSGVPLYVLYGSNTGSCEGFAQQISSGAVAKGFRAVIGTLDSITNNIPTDGPVVIVTASFEGEPADNAAHFVQGLSSTADVSDLQGVSYAVFGAGNRDWVHTYQRVPRLVDEVLGKKGAKRLLELGEADASGDRFSESFDEWEQKLWGILSKEYNLQSKGLNTAGIDIKFLGTPNNRAITLRQPDSRLGLVLENKLLTAPKAAAKRHIEFELPEGMTYQAGDYLAILPLNPPEYVRRVLSRFKVSSEQQIVINSAGPTTLPSGKQVSLAEVLAGFVEIGQPATKRNISTLLEFAKDPSDRSALELMLSDSPRVQSKSMLDLLEKYQAIDMPLGTFIASLPSMRLRQYSISSSPLLNPSRVTLTVSVVSHGQFLGVASNFIANLRKGDRVQMAVRTSAKAFHPPADPSVPMVMFAAGSGIAPFRGFIEERAAQAQAGRKVGKSVLFFGCRSPDEDYLYGQAELKEWSEIGVVDVRPAFSRAMEKSGGNKYVQNRVWADRKIVREAFNSDAKFYTCGGSNVASGIREVCIRIIAENKCDESEAEEYFKQIQNERYATDVFG
ncbi:cytochrome P450, partial [Rhizoctonia solani]